jgi:cell division protein FtsQ
MSWLIVWSNQRGLENNVAAFKKSGAKTKLTPRQKQGNATRRKRAVRKWFHTTARRLTFISIIVAVLGMTAGSWWFWRSGRLEQTVEAAAESLWQKTAKIGFKVSDIYLEGRNYTPIAEVNAALDVKMGDPILALSLTEIRKRLEAIPRVRYAEVTRELPDRLHVRLMERAPVAVWQNNGKLKLIDPDGVVMEYADAKQHTNLLVVVGEDAPGHTRELLAALASEPEIYKQLAAAVRVGERRWNLRFKNGLELKLPEQNPEEAWKQFVQMEQEHHILSRPIIYVDMRLSDRVFIKTQPAAMLNPKTAGGGRET